MADFILMTGDKAMFNPNFGQAIVVVRPGDLLGSGQAKISGKLVCIDGDEKKVIVVGCTYMTPQYSIPGVGMLSIQSLAGNQKAKKTKSGGKPVLLKGASFQAKFQVMVPAQQPSAPSPIPDVTPQYAGTGSFMTTNLKVKGT
jgi:Contractile injection system spike tip protein